MTHPRLQCGFTLIEVLVAMFVLSLLATGLLATTWRLVGFARDEAEHMVADNYCHDVMWAVYRQKYDYIPAGGTKKSDGTWKLSWHLYDPEQYPDRIDEMPRIVKIDWLGRKDVTYPLWRTKDKDKLPECIVTVEDDDEKDEDGTSVKKEIEVVLKWYSGKEEKAHTNTLTRSKGDFYVEEKVSSEDET